jgi:tRNA-2-methylthio-N6-dimethylallyladenosine synthase
MLKPTQKVFTPGAMLPENLLTRELNALAEEKTMREDLQGTAYLQATPPGAKSGRTAYIETYGCQMNFSDTEIIASVLNEMGYTFTAQEEAADLVFINTCSIRENAEEKVWNRLKRFRSLKRQKPDLTVGVLGCMAERLKGKLLDEEQLVDLVVGPDAYRSLPTLLADVGEGQRSVNVLLSREETYADLAPIRLNTNGVSAFISIMRGCDNMCSFCVVPFTRGRERSRDADSIVREAQELVAQGYREVTLLGQNVDSYKYTPDGGEAVNFAQLLRQVAMVDPRLRIRFSTSHPKDITDEVLHTMAEFPNICKFIHLPVQSGNTRILELMRRGYTREWYLERVARIREILPDCGLSTDIIAGFCSETEAEHRDTLSLMEAVRFDHAFMFYYSERPGTPAAKKLADDVPLDEKKRRLTEIIDLQNRHAQASNLADVGKTFCVLVEGNSKRSDNDLCGRNDQNKMIVFAKPVGSAANELLPGSYALVRITAATSATLLGELVSIETALPAGEGGVLV